MTASTSASDREHAGNAAPPDRRPGINTLGGLGALSLLLGASLVIWSGYAIFEHWTKPGALPYQRVLIEEGSAADFPDLDLEDGAAGEIRRYEIRTGGINRPLAEFMAVEREAGPPVPLSWESKLAEPVLLADAHVDDSKNVAETLAKHLPDNAVVFSWWDTARRLAFVGDVPVAFDLAGPHPILVPTVWANHGPSIQDAEQAYWTGKAVSLPGQADFDRFQEALLMDASEGIDALARMAGSQRAHIALNVFDAYKLGASSPDVFWDRLQGFRQVFRNPWYDQRRQGLDRGEWICLLYGVSHVRQRRQGVLFD